MAEAADLHETIRRVRRAIPADADRTLAETYDTDAYERARTEERLTIIAYEAARSADTRLRAWCDLAPAERRLWRGHRQELLGDLAAGRSGSGTASARHDRAWLVFGAITTALAQASETEIAAALSVFDAEARRVRRSGDEDPTPYRREAHEMSPPYLRIPRYA